MDYGKSGNPKLGKHEPQNKEVGKGAKKPGKARPTKEELLARMKASAEARR